MESPYPLPPPLSLGEGDPPAAAALARHAGLRPLDLGHRMIRRIGRRHRLGVADDHAHQRLLDALVDEPAIDAGRHRKQVALLEHGLKTLALMLDDEAQL